MAANKFTPLLRHEDVRPEELLGLRLPPTSKIDVNQLVERLLEAQDKLAKMRNNKFRLCYKYEHQLSPGVPQDGQRRQLEILTEANALLKATIALLEQYP
jgi:hypothetical protein